MLRALGGRRVASKREGGRGRGVRLGWPYDPIYLFIYFLNCPALHLQWSLVGYTDGWACSSPEGSAQRCAFGQNSSSTGLPMSLPQQKLSSSTAGPWLPLCGTEQHSDPLLAVFRAKESGVWAHQLRVLTQFPDSSLKTMECIPMEHRMLHTTEI